MINKSINPDITMFWNITTLYCKNLTIKVGVNTPAITNNKNIQG